MVPYPRRRSLRVNTFGKTSGDLYVPPQRGPPTIYASLTDNGTHAVTIEAVTLRSAGGRYWPVSPAGRMRDDATVISADQTK